MLVHRYASQHGSKMVRLPHQKVNLSLEPKNRGVICPTKRIAVLQCFLQIMSQVIFQMAFCETFMMTFRMTFQLNHPKDQICHIKCNFEE